ncbi:putative disease resistance protein At5g47280 [Telopea speciosissima]|uniref:putative disease resistance protein At5g47280 n=1 Tax=Telopea speciosissima TaxID=54955 RepID=UPI001CC60627|nr:putative disease resistance protein At5g47280 [Telopea speciosissima]
MALQFVGGIVLGPLAQELLNLIKDTTVKVFHFRKYLKKLQSTLESLIPLIEEVDRLNEEIKDRPRGLIQKMKAELEKGKDLMSKCSNVSIWNCFSKRSYSKKILKLEQDLLEIFQMPVPADTWVIAQTILAEGRARESKMMSLAGSGSEFSCAAPVPEITFGLDLPLMELKKMLLFREDVRVLGVCAPGGSGKTTLAAKLCRDQDVKDTFKNIFFLNVSSSPNLKEIVKRLFQQMKNQGPTFLDDDDAVRQLRILLEREPNTTLLVLDDVWDDLVVQKFDVVVKGYKILVTSRTQFSSFNCTYPLRVLSEPDAMALFRLSAFPQNGNGNWNYKEPDRHLLDKIVSSCKGHPLALKVIGRSLHQKPAKFWQNTERMLSSCSIIESHSDLLDCLGSSLDFLNKNVQECFMDLGAFPEDQSIPASSLIDMWAELYGIDEVAAYLNLHELSTRTLVNMFEITRGEAGEIDGNMNKLFVTQHDLLRDLAIYRSRRQGTRLIMERREDSLPKSWSEQEYKARLVSIHTGENFLSNWCNMHLPEAEVLILDFIATKYTLPPFMDKMEKLKVLIIVNHGHHYTQLNCLTTPGYFSHLKRVRLEKVMVPSLSEIAMPLKNLQKISFFMCEVAQALSSCTFNFPFMLPNLVEINIDYCNDLVELPQGICDLTHLTILSITNCHKLSALPERIGCIRDLEVLRLNACTELSKLPDSLRKLPKVRILDISDCMDMELPEWIRELRSLKKLNMKGCSEPRQFPGSAMNLVHLGNVICDEGTKDINLHWLGCTKSLRISQTV